MGDVSELLLQGDIDYNSGATFSLRASDSNDAPGSFIAKAGTSGGDAMLLVGTPQGSLSWAGDEVERVNSKGETTTGGWIRYESGLQICWGGCWHSTIFNFPVPFSEIPSISGAHVTSSESINRVFLTFGDLGPTGANVFMWNDSANAWGTGVGGFYLAIGRWK